MVRHALDQGLLRPVLTAWRPGGPRRLLCIWRISGVYLSYAPSRRYNIKIQAFADWAKSVFSALALALAPTTLP